MPTQITTLKHKETIADGTMSFSFAKPAGFDYKAGNYIDLTLIDPPEIDTEGSIRSFSLMSAPAEEDLRIATRMRDTAFKRVLRDMPIGGEIKVDGPFGSFNLPNSSDRPIVLLSGGIGITPFYSMAKYAVHEKLPHKIYLFDSNRKPEDSPFLLELYALTKENPNFRFIPTMTKPSESSQAWHGLTGYITTAMISEYVIEGLGRATYFISGPPGVVSEIYKMLVDAKVDTDHIRTDEFSGY